MPTVSEALYKFLNARKTLANANLIARWGINMETQVNVAVGDGGARGRETLHLHQRD